MSQENRHDLIDAIKCISDAEILVVSVDFPAFKFLLALERQLISRLVLQHNVYLAIDHGITIRDRIEQ